MPERFWEIDFLKVLAILMMIIFHTVYTLDFLGSYSIMNNFWRLFARACAGLFILLVGINLSYTKKSKGDIVSRGLFIFALGMIITLVTWLVLPQYYVRFGILHFIGLSLILSIPFLKNKNLNLILGGLILVIGSALYKSPGFNSLDYVSIIPWFGLILMGIFLGKEYYPQGKRVFQLFEPKEKTKQLLFFLSKHSLLIYFLHQPIIILMLKLVKFI